MFKDSINSIIGVLAISAFVVFLVQVFSTLFFLGIAPIIYMYTTYGLQTTVSYCFAMSVVCAIGFGTLIGIWYNGHNKNKLNPA